MALLFSSFHRVGHDANEPESITIDASRQGAVDYLNELVESVLNNVNRRSYTFQQETVEVSAALLQYQDGQDEDCYKGAAEVVAHRLHRTELTARELSANLKHEIPRGILIQAFIEDGGGKRLLIVKSDHDQFLDDLSLETRTGLPHKKKVFKAFLADVDTSGQITDLYVCDSSGTHSKYWWKTFLELEERRNDAHNSKTFWEVLDKEVLQPMRKKHRADYEIVRNAMILYVRSNTRFELSEFIDRTVGNYEPEDSSLSVPDLRETLRSLPNKNRNRLFDASFDIVRKEINARMKRTYRVQENIDLVLKDGLEHFRDDIQSFEENGVKYIKIKTDEEGYRAFLRKPSTIEDQ
jgi:37-kD nucleoid-associated bacterial protein